MMRERSDLHFIFLTKRIERFMDCNPEDWNDGYDTVTVGCTVENQDRADYRLSIFRELPIKHKNIICQPLIENINLSAYLKDVELVVVGGESDKMPDRLIMNGYLPYGSNVFSVMCILSFGNVGRILLKMGKTILDCP